MGEDVKACVRADVKACVREMSFLWFSGSHYLSRRRW